MASQSKIKELDADLINKIAAGEVVERPASAVKELVENAIDAGANNIVVEAKEGGKSFIRVTDDGAGMSKEDAKLSIKKHATSKLTSNEDLFKIATLGFRGEALASMAAVSHMEIITKSIYDLEGTKLEIESSEIKKEEEIGAPIGTSIKIEDLFYNTPARKNHLKGTEVEFSHISDIMQKYALAYPEIGFRLVHNGKDVLLAPPTNDMQGNIVNIFGLDFAKQLLKINAHFESGSVEGYIGKPSLNRGDRSLMITFINNRYVRNKELTDAIFEGYQSLLNTQRYPIAILNFKVPHEKIDVNVHPTKIDVRIEGIKDITRELSSSVRSILEENDLVPQIKFEQIKQSQLSSSNLPSTNLNDILQKKTSLMDELEEHKYRPIDKKDSVQTMMSAETEQVFEKPNPELIQKRETERLLENEMRRKEGLREIEDDKNELKTEQAATQLPAQRIVGRIHKTFIIVETASGMRMIDLHAAHERVNYELLLNKFKNNKINTQELIEPQQMSFTIEENSVIKQNLETFKEFGINMEEFGENTFIIRTLPTLLGKQLDKDIIHDLIRDARNEKFDSMDAKAEHWIHTMACRASAKAGDNLEHMEMSHLVSELLKCKQPHTCPHGRPTMIDFTVRDFEKFFNRVRGYENKGCKF